MKLLNSFTALNKLKVTQGISISQRRSVSGYIMQITMEKAAKQYIRTFTDDPVLESEVCGIIRDYKKEALDAYRLYEEHGIVAAIEKYNRNRKTVVKDLKRLNSRI